MFSSKAHNLLALAFFTFISCSTDSDLVNAVVEEPVAPEVNSNNPDSSDDDTESEPSSIESFLTVADFDLPAQDIDGFTILAPSPSSQIVYVSSLSGNDDTAVAYTADDPAIGGNVFSPADIKAFATISAAHATMRDGEPDMMLLEAGGVWEENLPISNGKSSEERSIYASYGEGARPELRTGSQRGLKDVQMSHVIISGIKFWAHTRDTDGPYFEGYEGKSGFGFYTREMADSRIVANVLIEDCVFHCYTGNVLTNGEHGGKRPMDKIVLRRTTISGNYKVNGHSQGLYYEGGGNTDGTSLLLQENFFYHNGWRVQKFDPNHRAAEDGQATMFNHNTYFTAAKGVLFQGNIFMKPSSIGNKWTGKETDGGSTQNVAIVNNLYLDGEVGISAGGNSEGPFRFRNMLISNNVMMNIGESRPTNRNLGWGIEILDWDGGEVVGNLILRQDSPDVGNVWGININTESAIRNTMIHDNILYGLNGNNHPARGLFRLNGDGLVENVRIYDNYLHNTDDRALLSYKNTNGFVISENNYQSTRVSEWFGKDQNWLDMEAWKADAEIDAETFDSATIWPEPQRDIASYMSAIGKGSSKDDFLRELQNQSKANWDVRLTAPYINQYIREGFGR